MTSPSPRRIAASQEGHPDVPSAAPDPEFLEAVRDGDPDALGRFFDLYFPRVYGLAMRLCGNRTDAEDLTQEVFLRVQRAVDRLDVRRDPWPWILTIARNRFMDSARQRRPVTLETDGPAPTDQRPDPTQAAELREQSELVQVALDHLPERQRLVVILRDYEGLSHDDIAAQLDTTSVNARKIYSRALTALGQRLKELGS